MSFITLLTSACSLGSRIPKSNRSAISKARAFSSRYLLPFSTVPWAKANYVAKPREPRKGSSKARHKLGPLLLSIYHRHQQTDVKVWQAGWIKVNYMWRYLDEISKFSKEMPQASNETKIDCLQRNENQANIMFSINNTGS